MGTRRVPQMSDSAICAAYRSGMARYDIGLRARLYDREVVEVLKRNGIALRTDAEWRAISEANRAAYRERRKLRLACGSAVQPIAC